MEIELIKDGMVKEVIKTDVKKYPHWTKVELDAPVNSDSIRINVTESVGNGGGLNEVKLIRYRQ